MRSWRRRYPPWVVAPVVVAFAGWCAFAGYLVAQARAGPVLIWNDSLVYAGMAHHSLWSRALWLGPRPPLTSLLIKAVGSSVALVTTQAVIGALAWGALAWTVACLVDPGWKRVISSFAVLAFATAFPITLWNRSELSESLSLSVLALVFAGFIWTARRPTWPRVASTAVACLGFAATRDAQVWTVGMFSVAAGVFALTRLRTDRNVALRAGVLALCLLAVAGVTEWGTLTSNRTNEDTADVFYVRIFPFPARVAWFTDHGMPQGQLIDRVAGETPQPTDAAKVVGIDPRNATFRPLERWLQAKGGKTYLLWLITHPAYVITEPLQRPERSFNFAQGDLDFYAPIADPVRSPLTSLLWPPLWELLGIAALALYVGFLSGSWRTDPWRMVAVLTLIGLPAMLVAWHGDGQEVTRHTIEGFAQIRLGVWILLIVGLLQLPTFEYGAHSRRRQPPGAARAADRTPTS
jgi:hypothetical protein